MEIYCKKGVRDLSINKYLYIAINIHAKRGGFSSFTNKPATVSLLRKFLLCLVEVREVEDQEREV